PIEFSKFGSEILEIAIKINNNFIAQLVFDKLFEYMKCNAANGYNMKLLSLIGKKLPELCNHNSNFLATKYLLNSSFLLAPFCSSVKYTSNTSLYAYSIDFVVKKSIPPSYKYLKILIIIIFIIPFAIIHLLFISFIHLIHFYMGQNETREEIIPTITFIVPFPQTSKYQKDIRNPWNELLYKPKPILFCNVDTNDFYKWWNFAAITDFKWRKLAKYYYYTIWFFYTIFFLCFALVSTLDQDLISDTNRTILFNITGILGCIHLFFEIEQLFWKPKFYVKDLWNLFGKYDT